MILLLMTKAEAPLLLVVKAARSIRDIRTALRTRTSAIKLQVARSRLQVARSNTVAH